MKDKTVVFRELQTRGSHTSLEWGFLDYIMTGSYKEIRWSNSGSAQVFL